MAEKEGGETADADRRKQLERLAKYYGCTPSEVLGRGLDEPKPPRSSGESLDGCPVDC